MTGHGNHEGAHFAEESYLKWQELLDILYQEIKDLVVKNRNKTASAPEKQLKTIFLQLIVDTCRSGQIIKQLEDESNSKERVNFAKLFKEEGIEFYLQINTSAAADQSAVEGKLEVGSRYSSFIFNKHMGAIYRDSLFALKPIPRVMGKFLLEQ